MNKKQWMIPLSAVMVMGLAGCASDTAKNANKLARPIGYYSNEDHPKTSNNYVFSDNDGGVTEMLDHSLGAEGKRSAERKRNMLQKRDENGNPENPTKPYAKKDHGFFIKDNRFSTSDVNYHGHLNKIIGYNGIGTDPDFQENVTDKLRSVVGRVNNVDAVRSIAYGNTILVSVKLHDQSKAKETQQAIMDAAKPYVNGRTVTVLVDEGAIGRDQNQNNDVPQMSPNEDVPHKRPH